MPGNKKRKKFNSNNSHNSQRGGNSYGARGTQGGARQGNRSSSQRGAQGGAVTVRERKKQLITERIHSDDVKSRGMRALGIIVMATLLLRLALLVYELVLYVSRQVDVHVISCLLFVPLLLLLFMVHDGNRGLIGIASVSAIVRLIYLFVTMYPELGEGTAALVFVVIYAVVMAAQFIMSVIALSMPSTDAYAKEMQNINLELRGAILNNRR